MAGATACLLDAHASRSLFRGLFHQRDFIEASGPEPTWPRWRRIMVARSIEGTGAGVTPWPGPDRLSANHGGVLGRQNQAKNPTLRQDCNEPAKASHEWTGACGAGPAWRGSFKAHYPLRNDFLTLALRAAKPKPWRFLSGFSTGHAALREIPSDAPHAQTSAIPNCQKSPALIGKPDC